MAGIIIDSSGIVDKPSGDGDTPSVFAGLLALPPAQFTLLSVVIGLVLAEKLNPNEQNSLGNFITVIGQTLTTVAGQAQFLQDAASDITDSTGDNTGNGEIYVQLTEMKKRIAELESRLNEK